LQRRVGPFIQGLKPSECVFSHAAGKTTDAKPVHDPLGEELENFERGITGEEVAKNCECTAGCLP
jgi:hypothetical protein